MNNGLAQQLNYNKHFYFHSGQMGSRKLIEPHKSNIKAYFSMSHPGKGQFDKKS
jgi:hypothetical protein